MNSLLLRLSWRILLMKLFVLRMRGSSIVITWVRVLLVKTEVVLIFLCSLKLLVTFLLVIWEISRYPAIVKRLSINICLIIRKSFISFKMFSFFVLSDIFSFFSVTAPIVLKIMVYIGFESRSIQVIWKGSFLQYFLIYLFFSITIVYYFWFFSLINFFFLRMVFRLIF